MCPTLTLPRPVESADPRLPSRPRGPKFNESPTFAYANFSRNPNLPGSSITTQTPFPGIFHCFRVTLAPPHSSKLSQAESRALLGSEGRDIFPSLAIVRQFPSLCAKGLLYQPAFPVQPPVARAARGSPSLPHFHLNGNPTSPM